MNIGGITEKGVDTPQPSPMVETSEASPKKLGEHHSTNRTYMNHTITSPQGKRGQTGDRYARGIMEGSVGHN